MGHECSSPKCHESLGFSQAPAEPCAKPAEFVQAEGHPKVRVFDRPDRSRANIIGEIPTHSRGFVIGEGPPTWCEVCHDDLQGWVGVKNVLLLPDNEQKNVMCLPDKAQLPILWPENKRHARDVKELLAMSLEADGVAIARPQGAALDPSCFAVQIAGPPETPYSGSIYKLRVTVPDGYPMDAPSVKFITPLFHPNISEDGDICLSLLNSMYSEWSPAYTFHKMLLSVIVLLSRPSLDEAPYNVEAAQLYESDRAGFHDKVKRDAFLHCDSARPCSQSQITVTVLSNGIAQI